MSDTYTRIRELGKGTFGTVYLCEKKHNKMRIVIKEITVDDNKDKFNAALNEISVLRSLSHPNICAYYDSFKRGNKFFIVMEYASYGNLHDYLERRRQGNELVIKSHALNMFCQILHGLNHLHSKKIIHRDLKTENIFLTGATRNYIKIGDFGISKILKSDRGKTDTVIGSTHYLAPEMCDGKPYDTKSDIWSLGCILYEICACERLFQGSISDVVMAIKSGQRKMINTQHFSVEMQEVIDATVEIDPERRPTTAKLMAYPVLVPRLCIITVNLGNIFDLYQFVEKGIDSPPAHLLNV